MVEIGIGCLGLSVGFGAAYFWLGRLRIENAILTEKIELQEKFHKESSEKLELKLKEISQQIFDEKSKRFREDSLRGMELILNPFPREDD